MTKRSTETTVDRQYKSRIFAMLFSNKKELLELYNALNGTAYTNEELLEINTLENAIYMSMQNDISCIIDLRLNLYEHQSTYSPNLPLRYLMYAADIYSAFTRGKNLYGTKLVKIPTPRFVIFYNGQEEQPEFREFRLSDAFTISEEAPNLELKAAMYNINRGHNRHLLSTCKTLGDYAEYTARVREYAKTMETKAAVERAITECINEGILADFLSRNRAEAKKVSIYEYDEQQHMDFVREEGIEEGLRQGVQQGVQAFLEAMAELGIDRITTVEKLTEKFQLNREEAEALAEKYWKSEN